MQTDVVAIVVTYYPDISVVENLKALRAQISRVVVVDNGSPAEALEFLRAACACPGNTLIENGKNLGIATALNLGLRHVTSMHAGWVVLFDQDSRVTDHFFATMVAAYEASPWGDQLGILVPRYVDSRLGTPLPPNLVERGLEAAMTSGSLLARAPILQNLATLSMNSSSMASTTSSASACARPGT